MARDDKCHASIQFLNCNPTTSRTHRSWKFLTGKNIWPEIILVFGIARRFEEKLINIACVILDEIHLLVIAVV